MTNTTVETHPNVLSTNAVIGDSVVNRTGENLGKIEELMLDLETGRVAYAVLSFGGFLGMGEKYHPIPWSALKYDEREGSYVVPFSRETHEAAPADSIDALVAGNAMAYRDRAYDYYHTPHYW